MPDSEPKEPGLIICWTTVAERADAQRLARLAVDEQLAACAQIDDPITSVYKWQGQVQADQEYRIWFKAPAPLLGKLETLVIANHPYDTPQWVCVQAEKVGEKYLKWANDVSSLRGFL